MAELLNSSRWICTLKVLFQALMDSKHSAPTVLLFMCHALHPANSSVYFGVEPPKSQRNKSYTLFPEANYPSAYLFIVSITPKLFYKIFTYYRKAQYRKMVKYIQPFPQTMFICYPSEQ